MAEFLLTFNTLTGWAVFKLCIVLLTTGVAVAMAFDSLPKFPGRKGDAP